jgi:hypothetical protein
MFAEKVDELLTPFIPVIMRSSRLPFKINGVESVDLLRLRLEQHQHGQLHACRHHHVKRNHENKLEKDDQI